MNGMQKVNGSTAIAQEEYSTSEAEHHSPSLEDSISSLLSSSERLHVNDETTITTNSYRRGAKLFINKKFYEAYKVVDSLVGDSVGLFNSGKIDESLFVNIWSLYFNLIDIFLNKAICSLPKHEKDQLSNNFFSNEFFEGFYKLDYLVNPKLIVLLVLIKLNNESTDLAELRSQVDLYLVNISPELNQEISKERYDAFQELLETYHIYLLPKLNEFEESEFLINTNPLINNPEELLSKLKQTKTDMEDKEKQKQELAKKRHQEAIRRKEQKLREEEEVRANKEMEKLRAETIATSSANHNSKLTKNSKKQAISNTSDNSIIQIFKSRLLSNKYLANSSSVLIVIFSLISILLFAKNHKIILNRRIRQYLATFWTKLATTLKMAFQVTYM